MSRAIDYQSLYDRLGYFTNPYWVLDFTKAIRINDPAYIIPSRAEIKAFLRMVKKTLKKENTKFWDCDMYSEYLKDEAGKYTNNLGLAKKWPLGTVSGYFKWMSHGEEPHTCNWVYMGRNEFSFIEPQTQTFHDIEECVIQSIRTLIV